METTQNKINYIAGINVFDRTFNEVVKSQQVSLSDKNKYKKALEIVVNLSSENINISHLYYKLITGKATTLEIRELFNLAGYNYWEKLENANMIDTFDSVCLKINTKVK